MKQRTRCHQLVCGRRRIVLIVSIYLTVVGLVCFTAIHNTRQQVNGNSDVGDGPIGPCRAPEKLRKDVIWLHACLAASHWHSAMHIITTLHPCPYHICVGPESKDIVLPDIHTYERIMQWATAIQQSYGELPLVLDINAGFGSLTIPLVAAGLRVWAFEESPLLVRQFEQSLCYNPHVRQHIQLFPFKLSGSEPGRSFDDLGLMLPAHSILSINASALPTLPFSGMKRYLVSNTAPTFIRLCWSLTAAAPDNIKSELLQLVGFGYKMATYDSDVSALLNDLAVQQVSKFHVDLTRRR